VDAEPAVLIELARDLRLAGLDVRESEPLARHTTFRIGGPADLFVVVRRREELQAALEGAERYGAPYFVLGGGANLLVSDVGVRGLVVCNRCAQTAVRWDEANAAGVPVSAEAGIGLGALARRLAAQGLGGLAWAEGIPGTLGGAIVGNAGAFGASMSDLVTSVVCRHRGNGQKVWPAGELRFDYRSSRLQGQNEVIVVTADLMAQRSDAATEMRWMEQYAERRRARQPAGANAGSVFKNPAGDFAGRLIEAAGLKGRQIGGAQISPQHANFIVNVGHAMAGDVKGLIDLVREEVAQRFGIALELEIELIGDF